MRYAPDFEQIELDEEEPLVIHGHGSAPQPALIIFLHGLGGRRYGTWTDKRQKPAESGFPKFVHQDFKQLDVGLYAYRTLWGRLRFWKSITLDHEAEVLADRIRQLVLAQDGIRYRAIILAGHSMGGILARAVLANLIEKGDIVTLQAIKGLVLMATPQAGSLRVPRLLGWLTADTRALVAHGDLVTRIASILENHVVSDSRLAATGKHYIPAYVVSGAEDIWVDKLSSGLGVAADRSTTVRGSHTSPVKPTHKNDDTYIWVRDRLREMLAPLRDPPNPFEDCDLAGKLLINRKTLRASMRDIVHADGRARILAVKGPPRSGKSHSIYFIEHVEQEAGFEKVIVELDEKGSPATFGPLDLAISILDLLQCDATRVPQPAVEATATRWVQRIAEHLVGHMKAKEKTVLIVLDGFAHPSLPAQTRELVRELVRHVDRERALRIVLLDCSDDLLIAQANSRLVTEEVRDLTDADVKMFFTALARSNGLADPGPAALDYLVQQVRQSVEDARSQAGSADESDNERVGKAVEAWALELSAPS